jgi:8-amino-7-oxononanoate synthase
LRVSVPGYLRRVEAMLARIRDEGRYREIATHSARGTIDFASNDYLALATEPQVVAALKHATRAGSGGARLLGGRHREHSLLEEELAQWLGRERALLFSSGYHAALGALPVLAQSVDAIASDERNHASLIDGIRLSHAPRSIYPHAALPPRAARGSSTLVVSESIFSMDGDAVDPRVLLDDLGDDDLLFVDEAHALGVAGPEGAGLARGLDDPRAIVMGTLSKALGAHGGFVAGPSPAIDLLINRARAFVFDTALPPSLALAARVALLLARRGDDRRARLAANASRLRAGLRELGFAAPDGVSPIVPVVLGSEQRALRVAQELRRAKIEAPAVRPPTVPAGTSRLRLSVRADHTPEQIDLVLKALARCIVTS